MRYPSKKTDSVSSLRNALRLLNQFNMDEPELNVSQIADKLEIGISTAHRLTGTLAKEGFIRKDPATKMYRPGASILAMGNIIVSQTKIGQVSMPILEKLVEKTGETAHIGKLRQNRVIYLNKIDGSHPVHLLSHAGKENPVHCTSSGQAILAYQPKEVIHKVIEMGLQRYTKNTITSGAQFIELLNKVKAQGYAWSMEELHEGVSSIAAPVKNASGKTIAFVSIAGPTQRINQHTAPRLIKLVVQAANEISGQMKHPEIRGQTP